MFLINGAFVIGQRIGLAVIWWVLVFLSIEQARASSAEADHVGEISQAELLARYPAFAVNFAEFVPTEQDLLQVQVLANKELVILFGTWCHDSVREVPRLLKLLAVSEVPLAALTLTGLDRRKRDPGGVATRHELKYTPTFIVLQRGKEIARVVERPEVSLAADLHRQLAE